MTSKTRIGIILATAMVATAAVSAGIVHRHHQAVAVAAAQTVALVAPAVPKPAAGTPIDAPSLNDPSNVAMDPNAPDQQSAGSAGAANQDDAAQADATSDDQAQPAPMLQPVVTVVRRVATARAAHVVRAAIAAAPVAEMNEAAVAAPAASPSHEALSSIVVPAGTALTLRLDEPLGSKISQADQSFSAALDRDVEVNGHRLIASGAHVTGKVLFARPAGRIAGEATLRLAVTSVKVRNRELDVLAAERSFGPTINSKNKVARFIKGIGKRLDGEEREVLLAEQTAYTFNLSQPLAIR